MIYDEGELSMSTKFIHVENLYKGARKILEEGLEIFEGNRLLKVQQLHEKLISKKFKIAITATTSSGKTTFVNSLIGLDLLPTSDEPKTAFATYIKSCPNDKHPYYRVIYKNKTYTEHVIDLDEIQETKKHLNELMEDQRAELIDYLEMYIKISAFGIANSENLPEVEIIDTPGPTSFGFHHKILQQQGKFSDCYHRSHLI